MLTNVVAAKATATGLLLGLALGAAVVAAARMRCAREAG
jgi:hypothetical protein